MSKPRPRTAFLMSLVGGSRWPRMIREREHGPLTCASCIPHTEPYIPNLPYYSPQTASSHLRPFLSSGCKSATCTCGNRMHESPRFGDHFNKTTTNAFGTTNDYQHLKPMSKILPNPKPGLVHILHDGSNHREKLCFPQVLDGGYAAGGARGKPAYYAALDIPYSKRQKVPELPHSKNKTWIRLPRHAQLQLQHHNT